MTALTHANALQPFILRDNILIGSSQISSNHKEEKNMGSYILETLRKSPTFIGEIESETGRVVTFKEMREQSVRCAMYMQALGIQPRDMVTVCVPNHVDAYIPYLACLYIGTKINFWHEDYLRNPDRILYFLLKLKPKIIFTSSKYITTLKDAAHTVTKRLTLPIFVSFDMFVNCQDNSQLASKGTVDQMDIDKFSCSCVSMIDPVIYMFSPNATHYSSIIPLSYEALFLSSNNLQPKMRKNDVALWYAPFSSLFGPFLTLRAILEHVTVIKSAKEFNEENMYEMIQTHKINWVLLDSKLCKKKLHGVDITKYNISSLKEIVCDHEISRKAYESLMSLVPNVSIVKVYNIFEVGTIACQKNESKMGCCGYIAPDMAVFIVDRKTRTILSSEKHGEIWCKYFCPRKNMFCQYYQPEFYKHSKSRGKIEDIDEQRIRCMGWFYTGDWGYYDKDGGIYVLDKVSYLITYYDRLLLSKSMTNVLEEHPHVEEAHLIIKPHSKSGNSITAVLKVSPEVQKTELEKLAKRLFLYDKEPILYLHVDVPRLPNGRIDRMKLVSLKSPHISSTPKQE